MIPSTDRTAALAAVFGEGGQLAEHVRGYRPRDGQLEMAAAVAAAIDGCGTLIAEAGTGTGKTFAYLVPAMSWGGKVIVSTGTKTLQDQLFRKDIPLVRDALGAPVTVALLKGRSNYLCHEHLQRTQENGRLTTRQDAIHLRSIVRFTQATGSGDRAELAEVPEQAPIWNLVTSTRDNCLGTECAHYQKCFVMKARRAAQDADVVVVNHHLFFADLVLRDEGITDLLPTANTIVFDEAHQLPETATLFFGETTSTAQVLELTRDALAEGHRHARDALVWLDAVAPVEKAARDLRLALGVAGDGSPQRLNLEQLPPVVADAPGAGRARARTGAAREGPREPGRTRRIDRAVLASRARAAGAHRAVEDARHRRHGHADDSLGRDLHAYAAVASNAAVGGGGFRSRARRYAARVDLHVGHARGEERLHPLHGAARPVERRCAQLAEPVRLRVAGLAVSAGRAARSAQFALYRDGGRRGVAGDPGRGRTHLRAVHDAARRAGRGRTPEGADRAGRIATFRC